MTQPSEKNASHVAIARHCWDPPIRVGVKPFVEFSHGIDEGLGQLVARWKPWASPRATQSRRDGIA